MRLGVKGREEESRDVKRRGEDREAEAGRLGGKRKRRRRRQQIYEAIGM